MKHFPLILFSVLLNAAAQILLRRGMSPFAETHFTNWAELSPALPRMAASLPLWGAIACYGVSIFVWMAVLAKVEVSLAYPMLSIGYLVALAYGFLWGGEQVGIERLAGVMLIGAGIFLLFRSA